MTNEEIRAELIDMMPFRHVDRFETLWLMLTPRHERLTSNQIKLQQELENEREMFWLALEDVVCSVLGIQSQMLYSKTRKREIVSARQIIFFIIRPCYMLSLANIGTHYGKDHATVLYGIRQVTWQIETDKYYAQDVERICYLLNEIGYNKPMKFYHKFIEHLQHEKEIKLKKQLKRK